MFNKFGLCCRVLDGRLEACPCTQARTCTEGTQPDEAEVWLSREGQWYRLDRYWTDGRHSAHWYYAEEGQAS